MSRSITGSKGCGYDFWSRRPFSGRGHGSSVKRWCIKAERGLAKKEVRRALNDL